ncbi:unnamed protein product [Symbiodinium natans]|uniref:Ubiquitin-like domain-containing protein n=1 Tax=Symbiodinium natans TaxID=878477 RepID=A0A812T5C5_9DINO|nr:unnamed protein product [Symbiodinium natans]
MPSNNPDPKLLPEKMLDVDSRQIEAAKEAELIKGIRVRFLEAGADRTIDGKSQYPKAIEVPGMSGQATILELRKKIASMEDMPLEDINLFAAETSLTDNVAIHECYMDWMGSGLDDWPPRFVELASVAAEVASAVVLRAGASVPWSLVQVVPQVSYFSYYLISAYLIFELRAELID